MYVPVRCGNTAAKRGAGGVEREREGEKKGKGERAMRLAQIA